MRFECIEAAVADKKGTDSNAERGGRGEKAMCKVNATRDLGTVVGGWVGAELGEGRGQQENNAKKEENRLKFNGLHTWIVWQQSGSDRRWFLLLNHVDRGVADLQSYSRLG